jgi:hypothetical protein
MTSANQEKRKTAGNYRKPPVEHQFQKGQSGNPKGRPKKKKFDPVPSTIGGGIQDRLDVIALDEATRKIAVREGDKVTEMPAMQALIRSMFRAAAQGDSKTGRQLLEMIARAESARATVAKEFLENVFRYKEEFGPKFDQRERDGLEPLEIYPHPDDIVIDRQTGEVTIDGPMSKEEAGAHKVVRGQALNSLRRLFEVEAALAQHPKDRKLRAELKELKKYKDFLEKTGERNIRREAAKQARRALQTDSPKPRRESVGDEDGA